MIKITVYSSDHCFHCTNLKKWLDDKSVKYTTYNVDENPIAAANMQRIGKQPYVPFTTLEFDNGKIETVVGCDVEKFEKFIKQDENKK